MGNENQSGSKILISNAHGQIVSPQKSNLPTQREKGANPLKAETKNATLRQKSPGKATKQSPPTPPYNPREQNGMIADQATEDINSMAATIGNLRMKIESLESEIEFHARGALQAKEANVKEKSIQHLAKMRAAQVTLKALQGKFLATQQAYMAVAGQAIDAQVEEVAGKMVEDMGFDIEGKEELEKEFEDLDEDKVKAVTVADVSHNHTHKDTPSKEVIPEKKIVEPPQNDYALRPNAVTNQQLNTSTPQPQYITATPPPLTVQATPQPFTVQASQPPKQLTPQAFVVPTPQPLVVPTPQAFSPISTTPAKPQVVMATFQAPAPLQFAPRQPITPVQPQKTLQVQSSPQPPKPSPYIQQVSPQPVNPGQKNPVQNQPIAYQSINPSTAQPLPYQPINFQQMNPPAPQPLMYTIPNQPQPYMQPPQQFYTYYR